MKFARPNFQTYNTIINMYVCVCVFFSDNFSDKYLLFTIFKLIINDKLPSISPRRFFLTLQHTPGGSHCQGGKGSHKSKLSGDAYSALLRFSYFIPARGRYGGADQKHSAQYAGGAAHLYPTTTTTTPSAMQYTCVFHPLQHLSPLSRAVCICQRETLTKKK